MTRARPVPYRPPVGIVLICVAGILSVLAALGTAFFALTQSGTASAIRYADMVRADLLARGGMQEAVARLRSMTYLKTEDPSDPWYGTDWMKGAKKRISLAYGTGTDTDGDGIIDNENGKTYQSYSRVLSSSAGDNSDRYTLEIDDAASKINVNSCDNLAVIMDNLCRLIGPPLVAANQDMIQPYRWYVESGNSVAAYGTNTNDLATNRDLYYTIDANSRPIQAADGTAVYGDGYAIAGFRGRNGAFQNLEWVKLALTFVDRNENGIADDPLEIMEIEAKYAALKPYITTDSWVDTNTVCSGKFEWVYPNKYDGTQDPVTLKVRPLDGGAPADTTCQILIDRDKSWVADKPEEDPLNQRGSLRGSWVSIINGHGAGQLRRIATNGTDWIAVRYDYADASKDERMVVVPGPISSYMIMAREDALLDSVSGGAGRPNIYLPRTVTVGANAGMLVDDPTINYKVQPLCIHRAPVNINTASDKVLAALFMGIHVQWGHPLSIGTDADLANLAAAWKRADTPINTGAYPYRHNKEGSLLTTKGMKRIPVDAGKLVFNRPALSASPDFAYLDNNGTLNGGLVSEAMELAYRIIQARQTRDHQGNVFAGNEPLSGYPRGPFRTWDDLYYRVVLPWDTARFAEIPAGHVALRARLIMAQFNSNTDILKFNPNIEWIDRWGRNFTEMEPVMVYTNDAEPHNSDPKVCGVDYAWTNTSRPIYAKQANLQEFGEVAGNEGYYVTRSFRYKSDELIDKTDLNRSTTEFSFDSNGVYSISCTGQVVMPITGQILAERKLEALIQVYDVWRESTQAQFVNGTITQAANQAVTDTFNKFNYSGTISRDALSGFTAPAGDPSRALSSATVKRLALTTLPEALVPLAYRLTQAGTGTNEEVVDIKAGDAVASGKRRDAFGDRTIDLDVPDVVCNRVLPALYDGQIVLATNTSRYNTASDTDTFLASFNGDLDSTASVYNGREQAKTPADCRVRVVDTFGLLGIPNDTQIDTDPDLPGSRKVYKFSVINNALKGLDPTLYWNNCSVRQGDLRPDGVYLSGPGIAGRDATLKYLYGPNKENLNPGSANGNCLSLWFKPTWRQSDNRHHELFNGSNVGNWWEARQIFLCKAGRYCWAVDEDGSNSGLSGSRARRNDLLFALEGVNSNSGMDRDCDAYLHGGVNRVPAANQAPNANPESSKYRIQPFRWHFSGARWNYSQTSPVPDKAGGSKGHWVAADDFTNPTNVHIHTKFARCFIDSQLDPEGSTTWAPTFYWERHAMYGQGYYDNACDLANTGAQSVANGSTGTDVKYDWADPSGTTNQLKCFGLNNLNYNNDAAIYRYTPEDGTYAVIDELKLSNKDRILIVATSAELPGYVCCANENGSYTLPGTCDVAYGANGHFAFKSGKSGTITYNNATFGDPCPGVAKKGYYKPPGGGAIAPDWAGDRIATEQTISRYYLPATPSDRTQCPTFTSQTLLQSLRGFDQTSSSETVTVARVTWNVFTPRFMHEYKLPANFSRTEYSYRTWVAKAATAAYVAVAAHNAGTPSLVKKFKGPFDYVLYNDDTYNESNTLTPWNVKERFYSVNRPHRSLYPNGQAHASQGVEIELLDDTTPLEAKYQDVTTGNWLDAISNPVSSTNSILTNPDVANRFGDAASPTRVRTDHLRYRVRFMYPVDPLVDPTSGSTVTPASQYLLDTPVFDDISITYFSKLRITYWREITE